MRTSPPRSLLLSLSLLLAPGLLLGPAAALAQPPPAAGPGVVLPSLAPLVDSVKAAVVNVDVQARSSRGRRGGNPLEDFFGPFGGQGQGREQVQRGQGSGFIIDAQGLVVTNNHVVEDAVSIRVRLSDGRSFDADVLGRDPQTDVALIRLKGKLENLPVVRFGDSDAVRVGDWLLAIGNPFGLASSVSLGILSGRGREIGASVYDEFLQTDAAINPGNSGGPLFNLRGEVVGINTAIINGGAGVGFAVPSNLARALVPQLEKEGRVTRGYLGLLPQDLTAELARALKVPVQEGALVSRVEENTPAAKAGVKAEDVIVAISGRPVKDARSLTRTVALMKPGSSATLTLYRAGQKRDVEVKLAPRPDEEAPGREGGERRGEPEQGGARVGMSLRGMDPRMAQAQDMSSEGALVTDVKPGSAAESAGLVPGMLVVEADRRKVRSDRELQRIIGEAKSGSVLLLRVEVPGGATQLRGLTIP
jgi:serine protease Do